MSTRETAKIIEFPRRPRPRPEAPVVDWDGWYHAEEIRKDQTGRA